MIKIICIVIGIFIILDFVPIKFASRMKDFDDNNENVYICRSIVVTGADWCADQELNPWLSERAYFLTENRDFFANISNIFTTDSIIPTFNTFVFWGTMKHKKVHDDFILDILEVNDWNILYPIRRNSIRGLYAPKGYFTIYDYDWIKVIKDLVNE